MIAKDFGIHVGTLDKWLREERVESEEGPETTQAESQELCELWKRNRLLEQDNEVLRRAAAFQSQANLPGKVPPASERARLGRYPCLGILCGASSSPERRISAG